MILLEKSIYNVIFISSLLYSLYRFYLTSHSSKIFNKTDLNDYQFECNLQLICEWPKDVSDQEWQIVKELYLTKSLLIFQFHSFGFYLFRRFLPKFLSAFVVAYSSISIAVLLTFDVLLLIYFNILIVITCQFLFIFIDFKWKKWSYYLFFLMTIIGSFKLDFSNNQEKNLLIQILFCWLNARCFSASIDLLIDNRINDSLLIRLAYLFYLPPFFFGPIYHYSDFSCQLNQFEKKRISFNVNEFINKTIQLFRFIFWALILEHLLCRYLYSSSLQYYVHLIERFDSWSLAGFGFSLTIMFYMKYLVIYGLPMAFSELDGFNKVIKKPPECIAHIHKTSYLWRTFDRGLYAFLVKYFYKPITGDDHQNPFKKIIAGIVCFLVVMVWHECHRSVIVWISLNILLSCCEIISTTCKQTNCYKQTIKKHLSNDMEQRLNHIFGSIYLMIAYLSNVFFLSNYECGMILSTRLLSIFSIPFIPMVFIFYCGCFVSNNINETIKKYN